MLDLIAIGFCFLLVWALFYWLWLKWLLNYLNEGGQPVNDDLPLPLWLHAFCGFVALVPTVPTFLLATHLF